VPFTITQDDIRELFGDGICPVLGIRYTWSGRTVEDSSPSLDRFIPELGYTKENCTVISNLANRIKNNATFTQIEQVANWMRQVAEQKQVQNVGR
jgi:hypothetical protein